MRKLLMATLLAAVPLPVAAQSQQAPQPAPPANAAAKAPADKMVCEREEQIGTRLGARRVCKTAAQWQEQREVQRREFEKVQQVVNIPINH